MRLLTQPIRETVHHDAAFVYGKQFVADTSNPGSLAYDASPANIGFGFGYQTGPASIHQTMWEAGLNKAMASCSAGDSWIGYTTTVIGGQDLDTTNSANSGGVWNSVLQVWGSFGTKTVTKSSSYSLTADDQVVLLNSTTLTATLPDATSHCMGRIYTIKLIANSTATVATTSSQKIDGATSFSLSAQYKYVTVQSDGTQWWVLANN